MSESHSFNAWQITVGPIALGLRTESHNKQENGYKKTQTKTPSKITSTDVTLGIISNNDWNSTAMRLPREMSA